MCQCANVPKGVEGGGAAFALHLHEMLWRFVYSGAVSLFGVVLNVRFCRSLFLRLVYSIAYGE